MYSRKKNEVRKRDRWWVEVKLINPLRRTIGKKGMQEMKSKRKRNMKNVFEYKWDFNPQRGTLRTIFPII